jgi:hypothetical protein
MKGREKHNDTHFPSDVWLKHQVAGSNALQSSGKKLYSVLSHITLATHNLAMQGRQDKKVDEGRKVCTLRTRVAIALWK